MTFEKTTLFTPHSQRPPLAAVCYYIMMEVREEVPPTAESAAGKTGELRLYVAGHTAKSLAALADLRPQFR